MNSYKWLPIVESLKNGEVLTLTEFNDLKCLLNRLNRHGTFGRCEKLPQGGWRVWASNEPGKGGRRRKNPTFLGLLPN